jgi:hypothetical protein
MVKVSDLLPNPTTLDGALQTVFIVGLAVVLVMYSMVFEMEYDSKLIDLYMYPGWRLLCAALVVAAILWTPRVGILVALVVFFYLADMHTLLTPFATTIKAA